MTPEEVWNASPEGTAFITSWCGYTDYAEVVWIKGTEYGVDTLDWEQLAWILPLPEGSFDRSKIVYS